MLSSLLLTLQTSSAPAIVAPGEPPPAKFALLATLLASLPLLLQGMSPGELAEVQGTYYNLTASLQGVGEILAEDFLQEATDRLTRAPRKGPTPPRELPSRQVARRLFP